MKGKVLFWTGLGTGVLIWAAASQIADPYQVNPVTILECRLARWLGEGLGAALCAAAAWGWCRRDRLSAWRAGGGGRRLALRIAALAMALLLAGLVGEAAARMLVSRTPSTSAATYKRADPVRHHKLDPGVDTWDVCPEWKVRVRTNRLGMRGPEPFETGKAKRILVLGDSYTEGYGIPEEETFCARLQALLAASGPVEVMNAGCSSYSPLLEWAQLQEIGPLLKPDLVVLAYDCSDVQDDYLYSQTATFTEDGDLLKVDGLPHRSLPLPETGFIRLLHPLKSSALYLAARNTLHAVCEAAIRRFLLRLDLPAAGDVAVDRLASTRTGMREKLAPDLLRSEGYVIRVRDLCRRLGARFVLVTYPYAQQVSGREWEKGRVKWGFLPGDVADPWLMRELAAFAGREKIAVIDLTEDLRTSSRFPLYYPQDGHWTAEGHAVAAEGIARGLRALGVVP